MWFTSSLQVNLQPTPVGSVCLLFFIHHVNCVDSLNGCAMTTQQHNQCAYYFYNYCGLHCLCRLHLYHRHCHCPCYHHNCHHSHHHQYHHHYKRFWSTKLYWQIQKRPKNNMCTTVSTITIAQSIGLECLLYKPILWTWDNLRNSSYP